MEGDAKNELAINTRTDYNLVLYYLVGTDVEHALFTGLMLCPGTNATKTVVFTAFLGQVAPRGPLI